MNRTNSLQGSYPPDSPFNHDLRYIAPTINPTPAIAKRIPFIDSVTEMFASTRFFAITNMYAEKGARKMAKSSFMSSGKTTLFNPSEGATKWM